jgi:predicted CXXCH cytochrome family protein
VGHRRPVSIVCIVTVLLVAMPLTAIAATPDGTGNPHARCENCHAGPSRSPATSDGTRPDAHCCLVCHWALLEAAAVSRHLGADLAVAPGRSVPVDGGKDDRVDCLSCHLPHPADTLLDPQSLLCLECHGSFLQTAPADEGDYTIHPIGIPASGMTPGPPGSPVLPLADVHGTPGASDDIIGCTTCHFAHGGPDPDLLRWSEDELVAACTQCHWNGDAKSRAETLVAAGR